VRIVVNSQWFMDPEAWEFLANHLLDDLVARLPAPALRAWSAGCSTGKEPFSLAVLLAEARPDLAWSILATDVDDAALTALRRRGPFTARDVENLPADWRKRHLEPGLPAFARAHLLERIDVAAHDLLHDAFPQQVGLVLYRNLETCFTAEQNAAVWRRFAGALLPGGIVFTGTLDRVPRAVEPLFEPLAPCFHRRR